MILTKFCMNDNIMKTLFFHNIIFDLKGHITSKKALYVYSFSLNNSSVKPTLPLMLLSCALLSPIPTKRVRDGSLFCSLDVETMSNFFYQIITLTYVLMDNFCPCLITIWFHPHIICSLYLNYFRC